MALIKLEIGTYLQVGGAVGKITEITDNEVEVSGDYFYSDGFKEEWSMRYLRSDIEKLDEQYVQGCWDASKLNPI